MERSPRTHCTKRVLGGAEGHRAEEASRDHAAAGLLGGAILETAVVAEIVKGYWNRGEEPQVYFWRTAAGAEVDVVVQVEGNLIPIEVRLSATPNLGMARSIEAFRRDFRKRAAKGYVVHAGDVRLPLGPDATALPLTDL